MIAPIASKEAIKAKWSAEAMTAEQYRKLLESATRLELSASVMHFIEEDPQPTFDEVIDVLGPPDELLDADHIVQQYGNTDDHDRCIRYRLGRSQTAPGVTPRMDQFMAEQICFKNGRATVAFGMGLDGDDALANFDDTRARNPRRHNQH